MTMNAAAMLLEAGDGAHTALACGDERMTYVALRESVARSAAAWLERGLERGDRVAIRLPDGIPWVTAYLGAIWAGGVAVGVNPRIAAEDWRYIVREGAFRFSLVESSDDAPPDDRSRTITLEDWTRASATGAALAPAAMHAESPAFWSHSSGTSGRPKAVVHAHRFALHVERVGTDLLGLTAEDRLYASSKLFFAYPLGNSLFTGLKIGATVILDPEWPTAPSVAATVARGRPTVLFSVPSLYRNLLKEGFATEIASGGVRACVSAGEALPPALREAWRRETGITIVDGYGASETLSLVLVDMGVGDGLSPAPGVAVQALDQHATAPMRVRIHTPMLALGYWNRPDADAESFRDGAFSPADLFDRGSAGTWRFTGREDCLIKIAGRWVNLIDLEQRLASACPDIAEAAVVSASDADGVAALAFFYVPRSEAPTTGDRAVGACVDALPPHQRPRWVRSVPSLPRTATGKLLRRQLQELHRALSAQEQAAGATERAH